MSTLSIEDRESTPIVELLSEFKSGPETSASRPEPKPVNAIAHPAQSPATSEAPAHIFVQTDAQDSPAAGVAVVQLVRGAWPNANVESHVERIPTQKMPNGAQVRYFNEVDAAKANRCASILRPDFPKIQVVRVGLPSPKGQLEIWLPKTSRAPVQP